MTEDRSVREPSVLYIEDSDHSIRLVEEAFRELDALDRLQVLKDGEEALRFLRDYDGDDSLVVLLDLNLIGLHGFEVLEGIRGDDALADLPVLVFTNSNHSADKQRATELGASAYREKPNTFEGYVTLVEELLSYPA